MIYPHEIISRIFKKSERPRKVYIIPLPFGFAFATLIIFIFLMAFVYSNNLVYGMVFFIISFSIQNMIRCTKNIEKAITEECYIEPFFYGEKGTLHLEIRNTATWDIYSLELSHHDFSQAVLIDSIARGNLSKNQISIKSSNRGYHFINKIKIQSKFPFDLFRSWKKVDLNIKYLVYPEKKGASIFEKNKNQAGKDMTDEFQYHEEYSTSSSLSRVDWRVYARTNELYVKKFSSVIEINTDFTWDQVHSIANFEDKISQLALWIDEAYINQLEFSLILQNKLFKKSRTAEHYHACLTELALCKS